MIENNLFCSQVREICDWSGMNDDCDQMALLLQITKLATSREWDFMSTQLHAWEKIRKDLVQKKANLFHKDAIAPSAERSLSEPERNQTATRNEGNPTKSSCAAATVVCHSTPQKQQRGGSAAPGVQSHAPAWVQPGLCWWAQEEKQRKRMQRLEKVRNILLPSLLRIKFTYISWQTCFAKKNTFLFWFHRWNVLNNSLKKLSEILILTTHSSTLISNYTFVYINKFHFHHFSATVNI